MYPPSTRVPARQRGQFVPQSAPALEAPRGAQQGAIGQPQAPVPAQFNQPQAVGYAPQMWQQPGMVPYGMPQGVPMVPYGADAGVMAGCGGGYPWLPGGVACGAPIMSPFAGVPADPNALWLQRYSLLGIILTPTTTAATTIEVACGGTLFHGCGGRSFNTENTYAFTEIVSGPNSINRICPGANVDVSYFRTDECFCPFDFGCFANSAPLVLTFVPITTTSVLPPFNFTVVGEKLESFGCPWYGYGPWLPPGVPPTVPPGSGVPIPAAVGSFAAPMGPAVM